MKKVIVTGATGMIGACMIEQMLKDGISVTALVRPDSNKMINLCSEKQLNIIECDIGAYRGIINCLNDKYDTLYHFAWNGTYGNSRNNVFLQEQNIKNTLDAVALAYHLGCNTFIGAGSQAEFGPVEGEISDQKPKHPITGYGIAKYTAGRLSQMLCEEYGIRHSWGRIVSTYGPRDNFHTMVMSSVIGMLKGKRLSFTKGEQNWDYLYGEDCSRAFYLIGESGKHGKYYTIGSGKVKKLYEYIQIIRDVINPTLEIGIGEIEYYPNQAMELKANLDDLRQDTGFEPMIEFTDGIAKTVEWYQKTKINL